MSVQITPPFVAASSQPDPTQSTPPLCADAALKQVEAALRTSEAKYRTLYEESPVMHINVDPQTGCIIDCNKLVVQRLGYETSDDIIGKPVLDFYHDAYQPQAQRAFTQFRQTGRVENTELVVRHKDGSNIPVILNVSSVYDEAGNTIFSSSTWVEITELKETQKKFVNQDMAFKQVLEETMSGYWDWRFKEEELYLSPTFKKLFGYTDEEIENSGEAWESLVHPEDLARAQAMFAKHVETNGQHPFDIEVRYFHKNGSIVWILSRGKIIERDEENNPVRMVGSIVDITPLKKAYFELQASEARRRHMIQEVKEYSIIFLSPDGKVEEWNRGAERIKGYRASEVIGKPFCLFYTEEDRAAEKPRKLIETAAREGQAHDEGWRVRKNGDRFWGSTTITAVHDEGGSVTGFTKVTRDLTLQKQVQETRQKYIKELEVNNQLKQFAYVASHDMQEPLRTISSYLQLLARRYKGQLGEDADEFIEFAVDGANRMQVLINDLLTYSKIDNETVTNAPVALGHVLEQVVRHLSIKIEETGAQISWDSLPTVYGCASQFAQLFQNLLANGIKFQKPGETPIIHIGVSDQANAWHFSFRDNGIGLEQKYADRIFTIFQRLHNREEYAGTGIGLATCKKIVERHGGKIWVESKQGQGATFFFTLPKRRRN